MNTRLLSKRLRDESSLSAGGNATKKCKIVLKNEKAKKRSMDGGGSKTEPLQINESIRKSKCSLFNPHELRNALLPTLETINARKLLKSFRIHLSTIKNKLSSGKYSDARSYVEDVWSMFENIWLSNPKDEYTELADAFELEVNPVMKALGYCCGKNYRFDPQELCCALKEECTISIDAHYFTHQSSYNICENCFTNSPGDTVTLDGESSSQTCIRKDQFMKVQNNISIPEPFVDCQDCGRRQHQICVLYSEKIWPNGFVCERCLATKGAKRAENRFNAKNLPVTKLDRHIEARVNNYLKTNKADIGQVVIRMLINTDETLAVKPSMRNLFVESGELSGVFPYRSKAIFAFQEIDGVDVCFFGFYVQEYGSKCPSPNTRRVYITFLDSVNFFQPRTYRTAVYHEILLGYIDFAKQLGYTWLHIWACPPPLGENYIFYNHPTDQKIPDASRLQKWYTTLLRKGKCEGIIVDFKNILKQSQEDNISTAARLPYFDDDYWPDFFEETIRSMGEKLRTVKSKGRRKRNCKSKTKKHSSHIKALPIIRQKIGLSSRLFSTMNQHKKQFFSVRLHSDESAATLAPIRDPDNVMTSSIMNGGHNAFFEFARDNSYEFSSLRRAQFSTMSILHELHHQESMVDYVCNICKLEVETRYHCRVCEDYDLCADCNEKIGHAHKMDRIGLKLDAEIPTIQTVNLIDSDDEASPSYLRTNLQAPGNETLPSDLPPNLEPPEKTHPQSFTHACKCSEVVCGIPLCFMMGTFIRDMKFCQKINGDCHIWKTFNTLLSRHSENCRNENCSYSFCRNNIAHIQQQQQKERQHSDQKVNIAASLQKISSDILNNRESTDPQVTLNQVVEIARVQIQLQEIIAAFNGQFTAQIRNFGTMDSMAQD